jgi:lipopolysaccharide export system permease protein
VPQEDIMQAVSAISPREMSSVDLWREIIVKTAELNERLDENYSRVLSNALNLEDTLRKGPSGETWNSRENSLSAFAREYQSAMMTKNDRSLQIYLVEYYKKFSIPFGALSFVFLSVSLGLMAKKSGQTVEFIFGIIISVIYWALLLGGQTMGLRLGYPPFWSIWMPNMLAASIGFVLFIIRIQK